MPIPPTMIRSLGATAPSRPNTELGMIVGAAITALAAESVVVKNCRLEDRVTFVDIALLLLGCCGALAFFQNGDSIRLRRVRFYNRPAIGRSSKAAVLRCL